MIRAIDCRTGMAEMAPDSVDAIVTDPPYGLAFMGKQWDHGVPGVPFWQAALRVLKPGGHLLAFGGTRTFHRLACAIEDAGFEIRDCLMWLYGSGFPKSHDVSKAIDREAGAVREVVGVNDDYLRRKPNGMQTAGSTAYNYSVRQQTTNAAITAPATPAAAQWTGWGTALKPAWEPIIMARKPLAGTVAQNVQRYGTGGINVDGCRIAGGKTPAPVGKYTGSRIGPERHTGVRDGSSDALGRWPANLILDEEAGAMLDEQAPRTGQLGPQLNGLEPSAAETGHVTGMRQRVAQAVRHDGLGGASRFFYCPKATRAERDAGLESMPIATGPARNTHPTVKPIALMRYLCRLVTQPGGVVLDPFMGSGSTGVACANENFEFVGFDLDQGYVDIARARIAAVAPLLVSA